MFGAEKKARGPFQFDIERELISNPKKAKELMEKVEKEKHELKNQLRTGISKQDFEVGGAIVQAFDALETVLKKISSTKR